MLPEGRLLRIEGADVMAGSLPIRCRELSELRVDAMKLKHQLCLGRRGDHIAYCFRLSFTSVHLARLTKASLDKKTSQRAFTCLTTTRAAGLIHTAETELLRRTTGHPWACTSSKIAQGNAAKTWEQSVSRIIEANVCQNLGAELYKALRAPTGKDLLTSLYRPSEGLS